MRSRRLIVAFIAAVPLVLGGFIASPTHAELNCPDGFWPVLVATEKDRQQDRNNNGVVCRKIDTSGALISGGPDDVRDDAF